MRDPQVMFIFNDMTDGPVAEPVSLRNDYLRINQEVYQYDEAGKRTHVVPTLKQELQAFAQTWFANLKHQRFFSETAVQGVVSF